MRRSDVSDAIFSILTSHHRIVHYNQNQTGPGGFQRSERNCVYVVSLSHQSLLSGEVDRVCQGEEFSEEQQRLLDNERLARLTEIALAASEGKKSKPTVHGVEPLMGSKFWASGDDDDDSSDVDELNSPMLLKEALEAGFTIKQLYQAESELTSPAILPML